MGRAGGASWDDKMATQKCCPWAGELVVATRWLTRSVANGLVGVGQGKTMATRKGCQQAKAQGANRKCFQLAVELARARWPPGSAANGAGSWLRHQNGHQEVLSTDQGVDRSWPRQQYSQQEVLLPGQSL